MVVVRFFLNIISGIINALGGTSMLKFLVRRIFASMPVLFAIMVITFGLTRAMPGGPFDAINQRSMPEHIRAQLEQRYGLTKSLFFDTPSDAAGAETTWGKHAFVKGGFSDTVEGAEDRTGVYDELGDTGVQFSGDYDLVRWDDEAQRLVDYELHPYESWVDENSDLVYSLSTLSSLTTTAASGLTVGSDGLANYVSSNATINSSVDVLREYSEDCRPYKQYPGWAVFARREECATSGGNVSFVLNQAGEVLRVDPLDSQFWNYFWNVLSFDFGPSLNVAERQENRQVSDEISERLPTSMRVGIVSVIFGFTFGIPLGVLAAVYQNSPIDYGATFLAVLGQSIPNIILAPVLIIIFAVELDWLPPPDRTVWREPFFSRDYLIALIMPTIALGTGMSSGIARLTRASLLQVMNEDYIRTARAKGLRERTVIYLHGLKNSLIPVATILGPLLAGVLTGTFIVELIFLIPGLGQAFIASVGARDYTTIMAVTLLYSTFLIAGNILVDIIYTWLDPRIRFD
jgi:oligopeptide transport system permease protein